MRKGALLLTLCALALTGCQTGRSAKGSFGPATVRDEIAQEVGKFIDFAMSENYDGIKSLVSPSQAGGFDGKLFIQDRFRLRPGTFQIIVWDKNRIGVTRAKEENLYLSSAVAHVRILSTNEVKPVYVNLHWTEERGSWRLLPFPEAN